MKINKKKLIITALKIMPYSIKSIAMAKALNKIKSKKINDLDSIVIELNILDLKEKWIVRYHEDKFITAKGLHPSVKISTKLVFLSTVASKQHIFNGIEKNKISILCNESDYTLIISLLESIDDASFSKLIKSIYRKLKISHLLPERFNLDQISIEEIKSDTDIEYLRDKAIYLEKENLPLAEKLMSLAHQARPDGPVIKQKLDEYRQRLAEAK